MNFKKKILAGLLSGALLVTSATVFAAPQIDHDRQAAHVGGWAKYFTDSYGVDTAQVEAALTRGVDIKDVQMAAILSKLSGKSFADVLAMKTDWFQVAEKLGVTREQLEEFHRNQMDEKLAHDAGVDVKTAQSLLKDGYKPHDIIAAGRIAKAANKNIKSVLDKRKINNTWEDVAKSFGVDIRKVMPHEVPPHEGQPPVD